MHPTPTHNNKNRPLTHSAYRYAFQAQERDDEIKGEGNSVNYTYRMHDTRLGRFFTIDPLVIGYSYNSPYSFSENRVIDGVELEGREYLYPDYPSNTKLKVAEQNAINLLFIRGATEKITANIIKIAQKYPTEENIGRAEKAFEQLKLIDNLYINAKNEYIQELEDYNTKVQEAEREYWKNDELYWSYFGDYVDYASYVVGVGVLKKLITEGLKDGVKYVIKKEVNELKKSVRSWDDIWDGAKDASTQKRPMKGIKEIDGSASETFAEIIKSKGGTVTKSTNKTGEVTVFKANDGTTFTMYKSHSGKQSSIFTTEGGKKVIRFSKE
jgi:hypothetical protein